MHLVHSIGRHIESGHLDELTLTTNGSQLSRFAQELYDTGVRRINVSRNTLDPQEFREITRWGDFDRVMEGFDAAPKHGLKIKLNAVALKGFNEHEIPNMMHFALGRGMDLTDIVTMPIGEIEEDRTDRNLPLSVLRENHEKEFTFRDIPFKTGGPARYVKAAETGGRRASSRR